MFDFCDQESVQRQNVAEGIFVRPFYLHSTCLAILDMEAGSFLPEHKHIHEQISYVLEGEAEVGIGPLSRTVGKGDFFFVKSNVVHSCRALSHDVTMIVASSPVLRDYVFSEE